MKICFVANYQKTIFFHEVSKYLLKKGVEIFWIAINKEQVTSLSNHYPPSNILLIDKSALKKNTKPVDDFKIKELVFGDRCLKNEKWGLDYLEKIQEPTYEFITKNKINVVIGELTWAHEILIMRMIKKRPEINSTYLNPHTIRIPPNKFAFFTNEFQSEILELPTPPMEETTPITLEAIPPDYLNLNNVLLKKSRKFSSRANKALNFFLRWKKDFNDPTLTTSHLNTLTKRVKEELNKELYSLLPRRKFTEEIKRTKYVLLTLHKQPEASIDVIGRYYENQETNILNISRSLPTHWKLLIKEHTNAIGDRSILFFLRLLRDPSIILIDENESSLNMVESAQLVITVSGTVAYEAAIKGIPSLTFADTFFNKLGHCRKLTIEDLRNREIPELIDSIKKSEDNTQEFTHWITRNSFDGIISDPTSNPNCMTKGNIEKVSDAILSVSREICANSFTV
ncbi:glycosyltransferase family protein [Pseudomonas knackmussii]|uniref:UDP-N-acetyl glucosamine 2-epimerase n=1 Tax=Pseudomonas knackmussii TaxID=65741 RepID=UPI0013628244|nr:UDP-N-acetyl glucosamine 2-epimerase [Pseudomonas knackmussii]